MTSFESLVGKGLSQGLSARLKVFSGRAEDWLSWKGRFEALIACLQIDLLGALRSEPPVSEEVWDGVCTCDTATSGVTTRAQGSAARVAREV